jgi:hypothetical protein
MASASFVAPQPQAWVTFNIIGAAIGAIAAVLLFRRKFAKN